MSDYAMVLPTPGGPENFERREITVSAPGAGEILVRHTAIGLNYLDTYHRTGLYPWPAPTDLVAGSEAAGVVEAAGEGVDLPVGTRVAYTWPLGAYCSARVIPASKVAVIPEGVSDQDAAAAMLKGLTAHYLVRSTYPIKAGDIALVHAAAGGVGLLLGQWIKALGATAIGVAGGPEKCALAAKHGYAHVIDSKSEDFVARVKEITGGAMCNVAYDGVGKDTWRGSLACLRTRGMFVTFGQASGPIEGFTLADLSKGGSLFATRPTLFNHIAAREELEERAAEMFARMADGSVHIEAARVLKLEDVADVHRLLESRATTGSTVMIP
ncbi:MAG: NADPH2:quinone reductase [Paracoccaceae bacterium]|jgi:NADPH2:quinone reductase